jgi:N-acetylmuramoyl-L-alanine amidase
MNSLLRAVLSRTTVSLTILSLTTVGLVVSALVVPAPALATVALAAPADQEEACSRPDEPPLPAPGTPGASGFWSRYRVPLPPAEVYNPPGPKHVGLQAGHWLTEAIPPELHGLGPGAHADGKDEWEVNLDIAVRTANLLRAAGVEVDVLPTTIPVEYKAHAFLAIHADGEESGTRQGFKLGRAAWSATPDADDRLIASIVQPYAEATHLEQEAVLPSRRMTAYYAYNSRRYCHAIAPGTPSAIIEAGYLTSPVDQQVLIDDPDAVALGIARGVLRFLDVPEQGLAGPASPDAY